MVSPFAWGQFDKLREYSKVSYGCFLGVGNQFNFARGQQTHVLVNWPHDRSDLRQFEREPERASDAKRACNDDGMRRTNPVGECAGQQAAERRCAELAAPEKDSSLDFSYRIAV